MNCCKIMSKRNPCVTKYCKVNCFWETKSNDVNLFVLHNCDLSQLYWDALSIVLPINIALALSEMTSNKYQYPIWVISTFNAYFVSMRLCRTAPSSLKWFTGVSSIFTNLQYKKFNQFSSTKSSKTMVSLAEWALLLLLLHFKFRLYVRRTSWWSV